ncbi:MAG: hypothetical protein JWO13_985 [Acidobacteriales bacterium]|nr:hypothetical protein [Terriglobales bacterium]
MNDVERSSRSGAVLLGLLLAAGLVIGGWALGAQIKATRLSESLCHSKRAGRAQSEI